MVHLTPTECATYIFSRAGFERTAESEAEHLFMESDSDKDEKLTKDEIIKQHELWVGSQATDYGRHLEQMPRDEL